MSELLVECRYCNTSFERDTSLSHWKHVKFCSDRCRKDFAARKKRDLYVPKEAKPAECLVCEKVFTQKVSSGRKQIYCSSACYLKRKSEKSHTQWAKERQTKPCSHCGAQFLPAKFHAGKQIYCSLNCRVAAIDRAHMLPYRRHGPYQQEMKAMRPVVLERDKVCVLCGSDKKLHVHHWDNSGGTENFNNSLDNLGAVCSSCHRCIHTVTLARVDGEWCLDGSIFSIIDIEGPVPIKVS